MANYTHQIKSMTQKTAKRLLVLHKKGFRMNHRHGQGLDLLDLLVIKTLGEQGQMKLLDLLALLEVDRLTINGVLGKLHKHGYLEREQCESDRRSYEVYLGDRGKVAYQEMIPTFDTMIDFILADMTVNEEKAVLKFLSKLNQFLSQNEPL